MEAVAPRVAFAGFGRQVREYLLPSLRQCHGAQVLACARSGIPPEFAALHRVQPTNSLDELVAHGITHLIIAASRASNGGLLARAIELGVRHVLVEKPPVANCRELATLHAMAQQRGVAVHVGMNFRHAPMLRDALSDARRRGGVADAVVEFSTGPIAPTEHEDAMRAALLEFGIHGLDLLLRLTEAETLNQASARRVGDGWRFNGHVTAAASGSLRIATHAGSFYTRIMITAADGASIVLEDFEHACIREPAGASSPWLSAKPALNLRYPTRRSHLSQHGYVSMLEHFLAGRSDTTDDLASLAATYQAIDALASAGRPVVAC